MPIYEYTCSDCNCEFELLVMGSDQPACPHCQSHQLEKLISVPFAPAGNSLPICDAPRSMPAGGCGLPQCGQGRCGME